MGWRLLQDKKGQGEIFNWIFSLIGGVIIFSFLVYFAIQNTDLFGKVTARVVSEELDILFSSYQTLESKSTLDFNKQVELKFSCSDDKQRFEINGKAGKTIWDKVVFAPSEIKSSNFKIMSKSWKVPFRVANFIYIWGDEIYALEDKPIGLKLPDDLSFTKVTPNEKIKFVKSLDIPCHAVPDKKTIYYKEEEGEYKGYICFEDGESSNFYGTEMLLGGVLTNTQEEFECKKKIIQKRLEIMKEVYRNKINNLVVSAGYQKCKPLKYNYNIFMEKLRPINKIEDLNFDKIKLLREINEDLIKGGCAGAY